MCIRRPRPRRIVLVALFSLCTPLTSLTDTSLRAAGLEATLLVATHDSARTSKDAADFVGDGKGDQEEINAAIEALPATGGTVLLAEGTYDIRKIAARTVRGRPVPRREPNGALGGVLIQRSHVTLEGRGAATQLIQAPGQNTNVIRIIGSGVGHITIRNLWVDANRDENPYGDGDSNVSHDRFEYCGIKAYYRVPGGPSGDVNHHITVESCYVFDSRRLGIMLEGPSMRVRNNVLGNAGSDSVEILTGPGEIRGNHVIITGRTHVAIGTDRADSITMVDNVVEIRKGGNLDIGFRSWSGSQRHVIASNVLTVAEGGRCALAMDIRGLGAAVTGNSLEAPAGSGTRLLIRGGNTIVSGNLLEGIDIEVGDTTDAGKSIVIGDNLLDNATIIHRRGRLERTGAGARVGLQRREDFTEPPGWEGHRHRLLPEQLPTTRQDFGHRPTHHAGAASGEIGGRIARSLTPASYAKVIPERTLDHPLSASGSFAFTSGEGNSGVLFGWFHEDSHGWRTNNSLVFRLDGNGNTCWVLYEYGTQNWRTGGGGTFSGRYQTTTDRPLPADGTRHTWALRYDPEGASGRGEITFELDGKAHRLPLREGHRKDGARFNRFGILNQQISGDAMTVYFDDVTLDGEAQDFSTDPGWECVGCTGVFEERVVRPLNDYGHGDTNHAGGATGEIGGTIWRTEEPSYYAARVGPLTLQDELVATGKIAFVEGASDAGVHIGWFRAGDATGTEYSPHRNALGALLEGPSRTGHLLSPVCKTTAGERHAVDGPKILPDGKPHRFTLHYRPPGPTTPAKLSVTLDGETATLKVDPRHRETHFDRFGFFNTGTGGHCVRVFLDDLTYTVEAPAR